MTAKARVINWFGEEQTRQGLANRYNIPVMSVNRWFRKYKKHTDIKAKLESRKDQPNLRAKLYPYPGGKMLTAPQIIKLKPWMTEDNIRYRSKLYPGNFYKIFYKGRLPSKTVPIVNIFNSGDPVEREDYEVKPEQAFNLITAMIVSAKEILYTVNRKEDKKKGDVQIFNDCQRWLQNKNGGLEWLISDSAVELDAGLSELHKYATEGYKTTKEVWSGKCE